MDNLFLTIVTGVTIFVTGQILVKMFIEPVQEMKKTIAKIKMELHRCSFQIFHSSVIETSEKKETIYILRSLSAELVAHIELVSCYKITSKLFNLPNKTKVIDASKNLIAITNWVVIPEHTQTGEKAFDYILKNIEELKNNLNIYLETGYEHETKTVEIDR